MSASRMEVRLDPDRRRKLAELSEARGVAASTLVRELIDAAYEDQDRAKRLTAVQQIAAMGIEDMPNPETLKRQILSKYDDALPRDLP